MVNGTNLVWNYLDRSTDIKRVLAKDIISIKSLSKYILEQNPGMNSTASGVETAIRRYIEENKFQEKDEALNKIFENTKLEMSSGNVILHINKTEHSISALTELFKKLNLLGDDSINLVMDKSSFALVFDDRHHQLIRGQFTEDKIIKEINDIGQITLKFDPAVMQTPNVFATILNEVGINHINVLDSVTKRERFTIFVNEKDLMDTTNVLYKFTKESRKKK